MMLRNPQARKQIQSRFKVILVDEAQDLNRAQHVMFGLMAGYLDPAKLGQVGQVEKISELARDDGQMTADTYCFIGDDKQAIYEFRGADPEAFIDMSDLVEGGAGFTTHVLETNYRSGKNIVEAANRLIAFNSKQIPMVCKANPERMDEGGIKTVSFPPAPPRDSSAPAKWVAEHIAEQMELGLESGGEGSMSYDSFGLGLRTNAEAMAYGVELIKKGIPFRSKINFFRDPATKALLGWLTIADEGLDGDVSAINDAVIKVVNTPVNMLGKKFVETLTERATGNYIEWLDDNGDSIYGRSKWTSYVRNFTDNLLKIADLKGKDMSSEEVLNEVLNLQGYDGTGIKDSLIERLRGDEERMAGLIAAAPDGRVDEEELVEEALAPVDPLKGLLGARGDLTESMNYVRQLDSANQKLAKSDDPNKGPVEPAVTLGTMHSWKGLEVPTMYIPMVGGSFPRFDKVTEEDLASERRLAYVAVTRAEDNAYILDVPTERQKGEKFITQTSRFVEELCAPVLDSKGKVAALSQEELDAMDDAEMESLSDELDAEIDAYLAEQEAPKRALMASWGDLLYTKQG
jgi:DNA helicase-2/ATP-dependent DNA helicase PcrA